MRHIKLLTVEIDRGMRYGTRISFFGEGDQLPGFLAGDVVCVLAQKLPKKDKWAKNWSLKVGINFISLILYREMTFISKRK